MSYLNKNLMTGEKLLLHTKLHWSIFFSAIAWLIITILIFTICGSWDFFNAELFNHPLYMWLSLASFFITLMHGISSYLRYITSQYAITNKRILKKTGLIHRKVLEIFLNKIESVHATQNLFGRLCNFGTITISGAGGSNEPFYNVPKPAEFRKIIHEQIHS